VFEQAYALHGKGSIPYSPRLPPLGAVYSVNISGDAHIPATTIVEPASVNLELVVSHVKSSGVPTVYLTLLNGSFTIGDETYPLSRGTTNISPVNAINIKESSEDSLNTVTAYAKLTERLPILTTEDPVKLVKAIENRPCEIQIRADIWVIDYFTGSISRIE
ncbi:MAG: hypothetical protein ACE5KA_08990, partial [Nitrososphaerales archaeon]